MFPPASKNISAATFDRVMTQPLRSGDDDGSGLLARCHRIQPLGGTVGAVNYIFFCRLQASQLCIEAKSRCGQVIQQG